MRQRNIHFSVTSGGAKCGWGKAQNLRFAPQFHRAPITFDVQLRKTRSSSVERLSSEATAALWFAALKFDIVCIGPLGLLGRFDWRISIGSFALPCLGFFCCIRVHNALRTSLMLLPVLVIISPLTLNHAGPLSQAPLSSAEP